MNELKVARNGSITLIVAEVTFRGRVFKAYGRDHDQAEIRLGKAVLAYKHFNGIEAGPHTISEVGQNASFDEVYNGLVTIDEKHTFALGDDE